MNTTSFHESRQTRRWRARQQTKRPVPDPHTRKPYVLLCRVEDAQGEGFSVMTEVEDSEEGDAFARELQAAPDDVLGEMQLPRCELAPNTVEALPAWATAVIKRRDAVRKWGEVLR